MSILFGTFAYIVVTFPLAIQFAVYGILISFVFVSPEGTNSKKDLNFWIDLALDFNKKAKASRKKK